VATVGACAGAIRERGLAAPILADAALLVRGPRYVTVIAGDPSDEATRALLEIVNGSFMPHVALVRVPAAGADDALSALTDVAAGSKARGGRATAYVCHGSACVEPTHDPETLRGLLTSGWSR